MRSTLRAMNVQRQMATVLAIAALAAAAIPFLDEPAPKKP